LDALIDTAYFSTVGSEVYEYRVLPSMPAQQDREPSRARSAWGPHRQASRTAINSRLTVAARRDRHLLALAVTTTTYGTTSVRQYVTPPAPKIFRIADKPAFPQRRSGWPAAVMLRQAFARDNVLPSHRTSIKRT
jgi:hypothetical protein